MANFFIFIFFGSIIGLIVGILKPKIVVKWKEEASQKDVLKVYLSLVFVSLVAIGIFAPKVEKEDTKVKVSTITKDKQEVLKLLNMSYHDLSQIEKGFSYFQKNLDSDIDTAISSVKRNESKVMKLTYKSYPNDFEDSKTKDISKEYIKALHNSNTFLQMAYNNFLDYIDNRKPTIMVKFKENIQHYQASKVKAILRAVALGRKYKLVYDEKTGTWIEEKHKLKAK